MKVAISGSGHGALELAQKLLDMEADVTILTQDENINQLGLPFNIKLGEVLRVQKRYLSAHQEIPGRSRFSDLFRIVYSPQYEVDTKQLSQLDPEILASLKEKIEVYEDFDVVIETDDTNFFPIQLAASFGPALGENRPQVKNKISYLEKDSSLLTLFNQNHSSTSMDDFKTLLLVGENLCAANALLNLENWLLKADHRLYILGQLENKIFWPKASDIITKHKIQFDQAMVTYENEKLIWNNLEDYIKAKQAAPLLPLPKIQIFSSHQVLSIDSMAEYKEVFVTIEDQNWDEQEEMFLPKTLKVDKILVAKGIQLNTQKYIGLRTGGNSCVHPEVGFYTLKEDGPENIREQISQIIQNLLSLFSRL